MIQIFNVPIWPTKGPIWEDPYVKPNHEKPNKSYPTYIIKTREI